MRIEPPVEPLVRAGEPPAADRLNLVILTGRLDRQIARARLDGVRERTVGLRQDPAAAKPGDRGIRHRLTGVLLGDLTAEQDTPG
jgi:hypothetical protein